MATLTNTPKSATSILTNASKNNASLTNVVKSLYYSSLLLQDGSYFLLQDGSNLLLQTTATPNATLTNVIKN